MELAVIIAGVVMLAVLVGTLAAGLWARFGCTEGELMEIGNEVVNLVERRIQEARARTPLGAPGASSSRRARVYRQGSSLAECIGRREVTTWMRRSRHGAPPGSR